MNELKIPKERFPILVGKKGEIKRDIENMTETKLKVGKEGDVIIDGEGLGVYDAHLIIKAIGRGFNPLDAFTLLKNEDYILEIINIKDYCGNSKKKLTRMKSRLIGTKGKARRMLETLTNTRIIVYGKTVSIIGEIYDVDLARRALDILLRGSPHGNVYKFIEKEVKKKVNYGETI